MKKLVIGAMIVISMGIMSGCGKETTDKTTSKAVETTEAVVTDINIEVKGLADSLLAEGDFKDELAEVNNEIALTRLYVVDSSKVADAIFYTNSNATAEEIAIVKVTDSKDTSVIVDAYNKRIEDQKAACEDYLPDEMPKLENAVVVEKGNYVILVISEDSNKANEIINNYIDK